jgi:hypothetical protein
MKEYACEYGMTYDRASLHVMTDCSEVEEQYLLRGLRHQGYKPWTAKNRWASYCTQEVLCLGNRTYTDALAEIDRLISLKSAWASREKRDREEEAARKIAEEEQEKEWARLYNERRAIDIDRALGWPEWQKRRSG